MLPILAQATSDPANSWTTVLALGVVINLFIGLGVLVRMFTGKSGERQIEPTQIAAIQAELGKQTTTLNKLDRETGELKTQIKAVDTKIDAQAVQVNNAFTRINAISTESAGVRARLEDHLQDHRGGRFDA